MNQTKAGTGLQLGSLRDALIEAGATAAHAKAAAEEVAGYENRLTRLTTMVQAMIAIGMLLLGSNSLTQREAHRLPRAQEGTPSGSPPNRRRPTPS